MGPSFTKYYHCSVANFGNIYLIALLLPKMAMSGLTKAFSCQFLASGDHLYVGKKATSARLAKCCLNLNIWLPIRQHLASLVDRLDVAKNSNVQIAKNSIWTGPENIGLPNLATYSKPAYSHACIIMYNDYISYGRVTVLSVVY